MKVIDMHCDTIPVIWESLSTEDPQELARNRSHVDLRKMKKGDYLLQNFAMFVDMGMDEDPFCAVMHLIDLFYREIEKNADQIRVAKNYADIMKNQEDGVLSAMLTVEEGGVCKGDLAYLRNLYRLGVRMMTLTWNYPNEIGNPNFNPTEVDAGAESAFDGSKGLTRLGLDFVAEMEQMGMIIDVSHLSDAGFWDVLHYTTKPFVASHSNARALCGHGRNLTDEMIRALAERGGVVGLNYLGSFLEKDGPDGMAPSRVEQMAKHARHIINVGGKECIGLGSDFDGIGGKLEIENCSMMPLLEQELRKQGFREDEIEGIFYKNVLRVYKDVLK